MSEVSSDFKINVFRTAPCDIQVVLVEIEHPLITDKIRLAQIENCKDGAGVPFSSNGETYIPCVFSFEYQKDIENEVPRAVFIVSNIGKPIMRWIEQSIGAKDAKITFKIVRQSEPDTVEIESKFTVASCTATLESISFELIIQNNFTRRGTRKVFDPNTAPGLF